MAIAGFIIHTLPESCIMAKEKICKIPGISTYGTYNDCYIVAVAETQSRHLEKLIGTIKKVDGVLACYITSLNNEDELD